jgi:hypothetical protein
MDLFDGADAKSVRIDDARTSGDRERDDGGDARIASVVFHREDRVILNVPGLRVRRHFSMVHARDIPLSPPAERFRSMLREATANLAHVGAGKGAGQRRRR